MSELTAGREALASIKALPAEAAAEKMADTLEKVLTLAEKWHGEYAGRDFQSNQDFAYTDGRDDAALELEILLVNVTAGLPQPVPVGS